MTFANPAGAAQANAARYVAALLEVLGQRDPLVVLAGQDAALRRRLVGQDASTLVRPEAPGKWSCLDVLRHLADSEVVYAFRLRLMLAEDGPPLTGFDQDRWAAAAAGRAAEAEAVVTELAAFRRSNLRLLEGLSPSQWARTGHHSERGPESIDRTVRLMAAHDLVHRAQLDRILGRSAE